uniref:NADH-ubiquinone oxidoreductase chain 6 n=1 Tax=Ophiopholis mirabilis TaxID=2705304 RepID=A0A6C0FH78_9ECHI|nr:NADH dehydrogenase subunit 6 [Ophiopholis mirabilis]QHT54269.1 NADH dehydrogenase subunit 6 [Ophiopholis mirabilis]
MLTLILLLVDGGAVFLIFSSSPFFSVFGVLAHCIGHSLLLSLLGVPFVSLLLIVVYAGGMLVVFLFSTVLSAEQFPSVDWKFFLLGWGALFLLCYPFVSLGWSPVLAESYSVLTYSEGFNSIFLGLGLVSVIVGIILLVALVAVLELGFEHGLKSLRKL